jgi:hypothetical protein
MLRNMASRRLWPADDPDAGVPRSRRDDLFREALGDAGGPCSAVRSRDRCCGAHFLRLPDAPWIDLFNEGEYLSPQLYFNAPGAAPLLIHGQMDL